METSDVLKTLRELPIGARLLVRSRVNWRYAVLSRVNEEKAMLSVCSPTGRTYRLHRDLNCEVIYDGIIPILKNDFGDTWRDNFSTYDERW